MNYRGSTRTMHRPGITFPSGDDRRLRPDPIVPAASAITPALWDQLTALEGRTVETPKASHSE